MGKLRCECGHVIHDHALGLDYKARLISDKNFDSFFRWLASEIQGYILAVQEDKTNQWMLSNGFSQDYVALRLNHGDVLHDHLYRKFLEQEQDVYECTQCGRLLIEKESNTFLSYSPENLSLNKLFKT